MSRANDMGLQSVNIETLQATYLRPSGEEGTINLPSKECAERLHAWLVGPVESTPLIQNAVPELNDDDRERCLSGMEPSDWDELFADDDDDDVEPFATDPDD